MNYTAKKNIPVDIIVKGNCLTSNKFGAGLEGKFESESGEILVIPGFIQEIPHGLFVFPPRRKKCGGMR